ncbi:MAG: hypothetical protein LBS45_03995 [Synergistaceae bacterium]|jgi:hypothetical protein|nr:hypothetical protein [Synergistaceae bacterium]
MRPDDAQLTGYKLLDDLERVIRLILLYPQGLSILLGYVSPPSSLELLSAFPPKAFDSLGIHCSQRPYEERITEMSAWIDDVIRQSGGWEHICQSVRDWKRMHLGDWDMMADHIRAVRPRQRWLNRTALQQLADVYRVDCRTIQRKRRAFPGILAEFILFGQRGDADEGCN